MRVSGAGDDGLQEDHLFVLVYEKVGNFDVHVIQINHFHRILAEESPLEVNQLSKEGSVRPNDWPLLV
jgi:hypothetical protein